MAFARNVHLVLPMCIWNFVMIYEMIVHLTMLSLYQTCSGEW